VADTTDPSGDAAVRAQYEAYPYPPRDPADEAKRLVTGSPSHILEIDHFLFAGRRDFGAPFRALVAGGGTGDATVMLAQQLADHGADAAEIVYLDIADSALDIARARVRARGLDNVRFVQGSVMDLAALDLGTFDYIDCCGVLHHLADPAAALGLLAASLAPDGGMGLMLYAPLGRTGVYHVQAMLRMMGDGDAAPDRLSLARQLLDNLPPTNWFKRNPFVGDHVGLADAGVHDLLLHPRDRAFAVTEVAGFVAGAGLRLVSFMEPLRYEPTVYLKDEALIHRVRALPALQRLAFAELLCGNIKTHVFYVVKADNRAATVAAPDSLDAVPVLRDIDGAAAADALARNPNFNVDFEGIKVAIPLPAIAPAVFRLVDGRRTLGQIHQAMVEGSAPGAAPDARAFLAEFNRLFFAVNGVSRMFLRYPGDAR
jgi:SAM-dependent methyltransferase